jgi:hypothetical protein
MDPNAILMPVFAMVTLSFFVMLRLAYVRNKAVAAKQVTLSYFRVFQGEGSESHEMIAVSRNYANLFEAPVLFYLVTVLYYVSFKVDHVALALTWGFVACRYIHTLVHIGGNDVRQRFMAFAMGQVFLLALWVKLGLAIYL